jgi:acid phosphatase
MLTSALWNYLCRLYKNMSNYILPVLVIFAGHFATAQTLPKPDHIVILLEENRNYSEIAGSLLAPYINSLLADTNTAVFTDYYALISGSQPNYLMLFSGATQGVSGSTITATQFITCNLGASLITAGYTFTGYSDSLPSVGFLGTTSGNYARKHNPWSNWQGSSTNQLAATTNQPFTAFPSHFDSLPTVSFVVPDLLHDMHSPSDSTAILPGDNWLKTNLDTYIQWAKTHNSLFILGFDESSDMSEHILFFVAGQGVKGGYYNEYTNNYRMLRTIEQMYGLSYCGNSDTAKAITSVWSTIMPTTGITAGSVSENTINAWPVPANDAVNISIRSAAADEAHISLIDQLGRTVKTATLKIASGENNLKMDVQNLNAGIYFIKVSGETINGFKKVIVAH